MNLHLTWNVIRQHAVYQLLIFIRRLSDEILGCVDIDPHRCINIPVTHHCLHGFDIHSGIIEPGAIGMPQHMAVNAGKEKRIIRVTGEHNFPVAITDDPLERFI